MKILSVLATTLFTQLVPARLLAGEAQQFSSIYEIPVKPMAETTAPATLAPYKGQVLLLVNVASKCGFTKQYDALEKLHAQHAAKGFAVLGFPANDFMGQEPGSDAEISEFCRTTYGVKFPIYSKIHVVGAEKSPLFRYLTEAQSPLPGEVRWNFEKFLIGRDGKLAARFPSKAKPDGPEITAAIEKALAAPQP